MEIRNNPSPLTIKQKRFFDFVRKYIQGNGVSPSHNELRKKFRLSSLSSVNHYMKILQEKGYVSREKHVPRAVRVRAERKIVQIPFKGYIAAGEPIEAVEQHETVSVPDNMVSSSGDHFALGVKGDSMIDEGIFDGDTVIIRKQSTAENGETIVALLNDNEVTLKKIFKEKTRIRLQPANPNLKPLYVRAVVVQGKVISVLRTIQDDAERPYYKQEDFTLYQGDCLNVLARLPENSVDMVFADPPYLLSNGGFTVHAGRRVSVNKGEWDKSNGLKKDFEFHLEWIRAVRRVLKPHGTIWISGTYHSIYQCGFALQVAGYHILNDIAWFKPNASPNLSCRYFTASHETLLWARKDKKAKHIFNYDLMKNGHWTEDFIKKPNMQMRSVWAMGAPKLIEKKFGKHPTQKPEDLLKRIVLASTNEGDLILDPFTGSSTTGIAAYLLGRHFIGVDTEPKYLDLSIKRFEELDKNIKSKLKLI